MDEKRTVTEYHLHIESPKQKTVWQAVRDMWQWLPGAIARRIDRVTDDLKDRYQ